MFVSFICNVQEWNNSQGILLLRIFWEYSKLKTEYSNWKLKLSWFLIFQEWPFILLVCVLHCFICVWLFTNLWTIALQAPLSMEILQAKILEWVAMLSSRRFSQPRDRTHDSFVSCIGGWVLYHWTIWEALPVSSHSLFLIPQLLAITNPPSVLVMCLFWILLDIKGIIPYVTLVSGFFHFMYKVYEVKNEGYLRFQGNSLYSVY